MEDGLHAVSLIDHASAGVPELAERFGVGEDAQGLFRESVDVIEAGQQPVLTVSDHLADGGRVGGQHGAAAREGVHQ